MKAIRKYLSVVFVVLLIFQMCAAFSLADIIYPSGDANLDYVVNVEDARQVLRFAIKLDGYTNAHIKICDINKDNVISVDDARAVLRSAIGLDIISSQVSVGDADFSQWAYQTNINPGSFGDIIPDQPTVLNKQSGTFIFYVYGYGHGLGMSQYGAVALSKSGCKYYDILRYYFSGTVLQTCDVPEYTSYCGERIKTNELVARIVYTEIYGIATEASSAEALRAQAICAFTLLKYYNYSVRSKWTAGVATSKQYSELPSSLKQACNDVAGIYLTQENDPYKQPIMTVYTASVGGATASSDYIWGSHVPYLQSVRSPLDLLYSSTVSVKILTKSQVLSKLAGYNINPESNPAEWIKILDHTCSIDQSRGYVTCVMVGDSILANEKVFSLFYEKIGLRSSCFTVEYVA